MAIDNVTPLAAFAAGVFTLAVFLSLASFGSKAAPALVRLKALFGVLVLAAGVAVPPAVLAPILAGSAGLFMLASAGFSPALLPPVAPTIQPAAIVRVIERIDPVRVFELDNGQGVVVFREVDGKLVSRFYRDRKGVTV